LTFGYKRKAAMTLGKWLAAAGAVVALALCAR
jgi:hypothetical protein